MYYVIIFYVGVFSLFTVVNALIDMEKLWHTHKNLLINLKEYTEIEENRLNVFKGY